MDNLLNFYEDTLHKWWDDSRGVKFKNVDEIPDLPQASEEEWRQFYVPILISRGAIPKCNLIIGHTYEGSCRNTSRAIWTGKKFSYHRYKFGFWSNDTINHFEDDNGYDLFVPIKDLGILKDERENE